MRRRRRPPFWAAWQAFGHGRVGRTEQVLSLHEGIVTAGPPGLRGIAPDLLVGAPVGVGGRMGNGRTLAGGRAAPDRWRRIQVSLAAGVVTGPLVCSVRSGRRSSAPAKKHSAPMKVPRFDRSALCGWPVDGLM